MSKYTQRKHLLFCKDAESILTANIANRHGAVYGTGQEGSATVVKLFADDVFLVASPERDLQHLPGGI